jgi:hypothetical protein
LNYPEKQKKKEKLNACYPSRTKIQLPRSAFLTTYSLFTPNPDYWDDLPGTGVPVRKSPTPVPSEHNPSSITMFGNWEPIKIPTPVKYFLIGLGFTLLVFAVYFLQISV